jgi:diaminohydroxyphosphoribosylaminopyrimidine deaminase/5-amino-6-(5-phosphoribosylamino)uracil reductase
MPGPAADACQDERYMRAALREAARGLGRTSPNPTVGAVIVRGARIVARGYHHAAGQPHAEIEALRALRNPGLARGATLYVTLEPCSTHGRTPPCTDAIMEAGLARVVIGATDPNPRHDGRAVALLRENGVSVITGVLAEECTRLNRAFNKWISTGEPWVIAKAALTRDGCLTRAPGAGRWLSGTRSRRHAHRQRALVDAILIGAGTLRADNPRLTVRGVRGAEMRQPWRIVLARGDLPAASHLFTDEWRERTLVFRGRSLGQVLRALGRRQVTSVLIEGGAQVLNQAFAAGLIDEVQLYVTPWFSGSAASQLRMNNRRGEAVTLLTETPQIERLGADVFLRAEVQRAGLDPGSVQNR